MCMWTYISHLFFLQSIIQQFLSSDEGSESGTLRDMYLEVFLGDLPSITMGLCPRSWAVSLPSHTLRHPGGGMAHCTKATAFPPASTPSQPSKHKAAFHPCRCSLLTHQLQREKRFLMLEITDVSTKTTENVKYNEVSPGATDTGTLHRHLLPWKCRHCVLLSSLHWARGWKTCVLPG